MPDTKRVPTAADHSLSGLLSTVWPLSQAHPSWSIHVAIAVNDWLATEVADENNILVTPELAQKALAHMLGKDPESKEAEVLAELFFDACEAVA